MKARLLVFLIIFFLILAKAIPAFNQQMSFNKVHPPEGKSFGIVTGITQDINGYMWFATQNGLYSYDGVQMNYYSHDSLNPNSIGNNRLESIFADTLGNIWIGGFGSGLDKLDLTTGRFTHFHSEKYRSNSLSNDTVTSIYGDKQGLLWIGTFDGLNQFDPRTKNFIHYRHNAADQASLSNNLVRSIYQDRQGTLWIGTGSPFPDDGGTPEDGGLNKMDKNTGTFIRYLHDADNIHSLRNNKIRSIFEDNQGVFWIGTAGNGLHKMDRQLGSFERIEYDPVHPEKLSGPSLTKESTINEHITLITQDAAGSYWVGTLGCGINYFNPKYGKTIHYQRDKNSSSGFNDNGAWVAHTSHDGSLWISNLEGNLYIVNPFHKEIKHQKKAGWVNCFYEDSGGIFWMGTDYGLLRKNMVTQQEKIWTHNPKNENSLANDWVMGIRPDSDGNLWLATHLGGLDRFDPKTEKFIHYKHDKNNPASLIGDSTHCLFFDDLKMLWIGTHNGLSRLDLKSGIFTNYKYDPLDSLTLGRGQVYSIVQEKNGMIWVAVDGGICRFDGKKGRFHRYLQNIGLKSVCIDAKGIIWAGGVQGLFYFDNPKDKFVQFKTRSFQNGIEQILAIIDDNKNNLWINTTNALLRINEKRDELYVFDVSSGILVQNNAIWRESYKARDGRLFMGTETGYHSFDPGEIDVAKPISVPLLHLIISIGNKELHTGTGSILSPPLWTMENTTLGYNQNTFSIDFNAVDFNTNGKIRYLYMLENYDTTWQDIGSDHKATFFNLPQGKYIFRAKALNGLGVIAEKKLVVIINPPLWRTWWAYTIYGLIIAASVFAVYRYQKQRIIKAERQRSQKIELAQAKEIEKAYTELKTTQAQLIQSEKMASLGELTAGIAHEIQNPLNFVNNFSEVNTELLHDLAEGPVKKLSGTDKEEADEIINNISQNLDKIYFHGQRADAIVKSMLQHSRASSGQKELTDMNVLADEYLRLAYHGMRAKDKSFNVTLQTDFDATLEKVNIIPQDIGRVLLNLYNNAFYAVNEKNKEAVNGYEPKVIVSTSLVPASENSLIRQSTNSIIISVKDNGNGIIEKVKAKIFQPFFTTKPSGRGLGLGLSLSYDIIKAHGGEIKVETKESEGSEFIISLPIA